MEIERENARLKALHAYAILDTPPEDEFENIVQLASQICQVPISLISLIDQDRQWFKARKGLSVQETPRCDAFCAHAIVQQGIMVVEDALNDERFVNNPLVTGNPDIRFYAGAPLLTPDGHALGTLCVIDRVPRQLSQEQYFALSTLARQVVTQLELRHTVTHLNRVVASRNQILSIISHDIKSPLQSILTLMDLFLEDKIPPHEMKQVALQMQQAVLSTDQLLSNLAEWFIAQLERGGMHPVEFDLQDKLMSIIAAAQAQAQTKNNVLTSHLQENVMLTADVNMFTFIIRNLLQNAIKFTQDGEITVSARAVSGQAHITIKDTGTGITATRLARLFDWQKHRSALGTAKERGHGLGLLICKEFIDKHNGSIEVASTLGEGTEIQVLLPLHQAE